MPAPDRFVRVTLEAPFCNVDGEPLDKVVLRYGCEDARRVAGSYYAGDQVPMSDRPWEAEGQAGRAPQFIPGKPIDSVMVWDDEDMRSVIVADYVAHHYFGDWRIPISQANNPGNPERTYPAEKRRVATIWGDYKKEPRDVRIPNHWRSLRKIAPPNVPRVLIVELDSAQRRVPGSEYRPWSHFAWEKDCVKLAPTMEEQLATAQQSQGGIYLTPAQLEEMVAKSVAEAMSKVNKKAAAA